MYLARVCVLFYVCCCPLLLHAASLGVWPINPRIDSNDSATMVWVKNNNQDKPVMLQARVFAWRQEGNEDKYDAQDELVVSPPFIEVKPAAQQVFRIVNRTGPVKGVITEKSYRVLIDEIPDAKNDKKILLNFQMRYSLPLFVGLPADYAVMGIKDRLKALEGALRYRVVTGAEPALEILNHGQIHTRLSGVRIRISTARAQDVFISEGLMGYVLPGAVRRWPLNKEQLAALSKPNAALIFLQEREELTIAAEK